MGWIPNSEQMPEFYQNVIAFSEEDGIHTAYYDRLGKWSVMAEGTTLSGVTHWQPLPEPPK